MVFILINLHQLHKQFCLEPQKKKNDEWLKSSHICELVISYSIL